jgi:hypothetical protein
MTSSRICSPNESAPHRSLVPDAPAARGAYSDQTKTLRALTHAREDLVHARVALSNQLRAELERFWPGPIGLF